MFYLSFFQLIFKNLICLQKFCFKKIWGIIKQVPKIGCFLVERRSSNTINQIILYNMIQGSIVVTGGWRRKMISKKT